MADIEKIKIAKEWISKLANGVNPINGQELKDDDIVNNVHISRCLFFVSEVLGDTISRTKSKTYDLPFTMNAEDAKKVAITDRTGISNFAKAINSVIPENMKPLATTSIIGWLKGEGYMEEVAKDESHKTHLPTHKGNQIGISTEERDSYSGGKYISVVYNADAQRFILENIEAIAPKTK